MAFLKDHRLRLEVSSSNFPRYNRNLNAAEPTALATMPQFARQRVFHSSLLLSRIILPVVR